MMKKIIAFTFGFFLAFTFQSFAQDNEKKGQITFEETSHDFGNIQQGVVVEYTFKFKNTGNAPFVISNVRTTCGCTATKWPREPIAIGQNAEITAQFNSAGKSGAQNKVITVISNAKNAQEIVSIKANVVVKNDEQR